MVARRRSTLEFKERLCARCDMLVSDAPLNYSPPVVSRVSHRVVLPIAVTLGLGIGIVDVTSSSIQRNPVGNSESLVIIPPYYTPTPCDIRIDTSMMPRARNSSFGLLTVMPLYGTTAAPIIWFVKFSARSKLRGWSQLESDHCVFRTCIKGRLRGICPLRVDDVLLSSDTIGRNSITYVLKVFLRSGIQYLTNEGNMTYLGVDIGYDQKQLVTSQDNFVEVKLDAIDEQKYYLSPDKIISSRKRLAECKRAVGNLIWILQTRPDIAHKLREMASQVVEIVRRAKTFPMRMRGGGPIN